MPRRANTRRVRLKKARGSTRADGLGTRLRLWGVMAGVLVSSWLVLEYVTLPEVGELARKNPATTALIEQRAEEAREAGRRPRRKQHWVGLAQVSKHAIDAVLLSEDAAFFQHDGVDRVEMQRALEDAWEKGQLGRGASTLTMQLAKNLWLSTDRSLVRKLKELVLTARLEEALPKKRILTLYLNVAEWGDGVYGIEAGALEHFGIPAAELRPAQAAVLASMLPAPRTWSPAKRSKRLHSRALGLLDRMANAGRLTRDEADAAKEEVDLLFSGVSAVTDEDGP